MDIRDLYHAAPLQYVPHILQSGALYAQSVLAGQGILPRASAARRDRMLGLADYVHLSLRADTPLLRDKLSKGYPHVLFCFDAEAVLHLPETAFVRYNAKSWYSKSAFVPIIDSEEKTRVLRQYADGRYPSLEFLVKYGLSLTHARHVLFAAPQEQIVIESLLPVLGILNAVPFKTAPESFPGIEIYQPKTFAAIQAYLDQCMREGCLLPPPMIPFD